MGKAARKAAKGTLRALPELPLRQQRRLIATLLINESGWDAAAAADAAGFARPADARLWADWHSLLGHVRHDDGSSRGPAQLFDTSAVKNLGSALMRTSGSWVKRGSGLSIAGWICKR